MVIATEFVTKQIYFSSTQYVGNEERKFVDVINLLNDVTYDVRNNLNHISFVEVKYIGYYSKCCLAHKKYKEKLYISSTSDISV